MGLTKVNHPDLLDLASDTGATVFPKGTTAERPVNPEAGYIRFNTTDNVMETYDGTEWLVLDTLPPVLTVDYLVVAGGAGGGGGYAGSVGGGGGAGGYIYNTSYILTQSTSYTITVGAGGAATGDSAQANPGSNSVFDLFTANGGGKGGNNNSYNPSNGGSGGSGGGGFGAAFSGTSLGGNGTVGQGNNGGNAGPGAGGGAGAGGGGGASQVGGTGLGAGGTAIGGNGGNGIQLNITGSTVYYCGGGGGGGANIPGTGGLGGGGNGNTNSGSGASGSVNTGGGGGGGAGNLASGGSGVVILRMPTANYSGTTTGSPTVTTDGSGNTILTYTSSGTYTA